jgi:hypothetical protein
VQEFIKEKKIDSIKRKYPDIFKDMGFIQLAEVYPFYIIPEENIYPKNLRDINSMADQLMKRAKIALAKEWDELREVHKTHDRRYYERIKEKQNPLNFNMLLMRVNRRNMRHRYNIRNDFNQAFVSELSSIVALEKFKMYEQEKVAINKLIFSSSIHILVLGIEKKDREKILELEKVFTAPCAEGGLGVKKFFDYHKQDSKKISNILATKFKNNPEKVKTYTEFIVKNSRDYQEDLEKLKIRY